MSCTRWIVAFALLAGAVGAAPAQDRDQLERRSQSVGTLIESSSAARQIETSGVAAARDKREAARALHQQAVAALRGGDSANAAKLLDQAARSMMEGARLAKPEQVRGEKQRKDFADRLESTKALLAAQQRITQEKGAGSEAQEAARSIAAQVAEAEKLAAADRMPEARVMVDRAYLTARVSIETLRRGDTLVRSLNFATKQEEYEYEIDRNETHKMLIGVLLSDRKDAAPLVSPFVERAAALRAQAEAQARGGDHAGAIKVLEDSTRELVRAIRAGGIYIPG